MIGYEIARDFHFIERHNSVISLHVPSMTVLDLHPAAAALLRLQATYNSQAESQTQLLPSKYSPGVVNQAIRELDALASDGCFEPVDIANESIDDTFPSLIWLHVAHTCNMNCVYCFAGHGTYADSPSIMTLDTARASLDWILKYKKHDERTHILFFGGEPLLNFYTIRATIEHAARCNADKRFVWGIITNGVLLNVEVSDYLIAQGFHITISIDGPPDVQNRLRPLKNGKNVSGQLEAAVRYLLAESGLPVSVRATITHENLDLLSSFEYFRQLGFHYMSFMPTLGLRSDRWTLQNTSWDRYFEQMTLVADEVIRYAFNGDFIHIRPLDNYLEKINFRIATGNCGAAVEGLAISSDGQVFPCSRFVGEHRFGYGYIGERWDPARNAFFRVKSTLSQPECQDCWARFYCEGGCPYYNLKEQYDACRPTPDFCHHYRQLTELALVTYARLAERPETLERYFGEPNTTDSHLSRLNGMTTGKEVR